MSYDLILIRVPTDASEEDIAAAALAAADDELSRPSGPPDLVEETRKQALSNALLAACPELTRSTLDYASIASSERITETEARQRYRWIELNGPEDGAGVQITLYDTWVSIAMPWSGPDGDIDELWRYLEVLVREGGFTVFDPTGPNVIDVAAGRRGHGRPPSQQPARKNRGKRSRHGSDDDASSSNQGPASDLGKLIDQVSRAALSEPLDAAGFKRDGRTWRRHLTHAIQVVNIQGPRRNDGAEAEFTLNAGVYFPGVAKRLAIFPVTNAPKEHDCHLRKRPLPPGRDWLKVRIPGATEPEADAGRFLGAIFAWLDRRADERAPAMQERATSDLRQAIERQALPWLERMADLRIARDEFVRQRDVRSAVAASLELGEHEEAERLFKRAIEAEQKDADELLGWGRANGLSV